MRAEQYGPWALIAGGSEGIGASFARRFAQAGINLVLVARKPEPLQTLADEVRVSHRVDVRVASLNLTAPDMLEKVRLLTDDIEVGMLVYNAGNDSLSKEFLDRSLDDAQRPILLNVIGQTQLCHHLGGKMRARRRGGIILVGSLLAYAGGGKMATYAAAKAYSHTFAKGLWHELRPYNVDVLGLVASATRTPSYERFGLPADYNGIHASEPDLVADEGLAYLGKGPTWVVSEAAALAQHLYNLPPADAVALVSSNTADMLANKT
jgi:uncharacterized protein